MVALAHTTQNSLPLARARLHGHGRQHARLRRVTAKAAMGKGGLTHVMNVFFDVASSQQRNPDHLVSLLADEIIEAGVAHRNSLGNKDEKLSLEDCLSAKSLSPFLDSYAVRTWLHSSVVNHEIRSSFTLSDTSQMQRHRVTLASGEHILLTFALSLESTLQARYKGIGCSESWFIRQIKGDWAEMSDAPSPSMGPEACLERQLQALREGDVSTVFKFASPSNKLQTGPIERFTTMLTNPQYTTLLGHVDAEVMQGKHFNEDTFVAMVRIVPSERASTPPPLYVWTLTRQHGPVFNNCWMTDSVQAWATACTWLASDDKEGRSK